MSRPTRLALFAASAVCMAGMFLAAFLSMPHFGSAHHPYRDLAVPAAVHHLTANVVSSVNFDQRGFDTLGEESILLASVMGATVLLRPAKEERERQVDNSGRTLEATKFLSYVMLPVTLIIGFNVVTYGHLTPGGGFQGGVVLGTGLHLMYVGGSYPALERIRPTEAFEWGEALGAAAFAALGIAGVLAAGAFLANIFNGGSFGDLLSAGTVPVLNGAVGVEVASGVMVLLAAFLNQEILVRPASAATGGGRR